MYVLSWFSTRNCAQMSGSWHNNDNRNKNISIRPARSNVPYQLSCLFPNRIAADSISFIYYTHLHIIQISVGSVFSISQVRCAYVIQVVHWYRQQHQTCINSCAYPSVFCPLALCRRLTDKIKMEQTEWLLTTMSWAYEQAIWLLLLRQTV